MLSYEEDIPKDVLKNLERRGHKLKPRDHIATVNLIVRTKDGLEAASEFRSGGAPVAEH